MRVARPHGTVKCIAFRASPALVGAMLALGWPVRAHPIERDLFVVPSAIVSNSQLNELLHREDFIYLATVAFLVSPTGSNQTYTSDPTWNNSNNTVDCIGGGGGGGAAFNSDSVNGGGGGGGGHSRNTNFVFAAPGVTTATWQCGAFGVGDVNDTRGAGAGGSTWFNGTTLAGSSVGANGGAGGDAGAFDGVGGAGGSTTGATGTTKHSGGAGGNGTASSTGSGGGAGGPSGNGSAGAVGGAGGAADGGTVAGGSIGSNGNSGTEFDSSHGCGSGAGSVNTGGDKAGGNYGGGGSGAFGSGISVQDGGNGAQGIIALTWVVAVLGLRRRAIVYRR